MKKRILIISIVIIVLTVISMIAYHSNNLTIFVNNLSRDNFELRTEIYINDELIVKENIRQDLRNNFNDFFRIWHGKGMENILKVVVNNKYEMTKKINITADTKIMITLGGKDFSMISDENIVINVLNDCKTCPNTFFNKVYY